MNHCGSLFYNEDYTCVNDEPDQTNATDPATGRLYEMVLNVLWMDAQWLHAVYYKQGQADPRCGQCPNSIAPTGCGPSRRGFFLRFELELFPAALPPPPTLAIAPPPALEYCRQHSAPRS